MVKGKDIALRWGCSPAYVSKLKKRGMPLDNFEAADAWRSAHALEGIGHKSTAPAVPQATLAEAEAHLAKHTAAAPPAAEPLVDSDPRSAVQRAQTAERDIYDLLASATKKARDDAAPDRFAAAAALPGLIRTHANAYANRLDAEARWEKHRRSTGEVATIAELMEIMEAALVPLTSQLRNLPRTVAASANPAAPDIAENALRAAIDPVLAQIAASLVAPSPATPPPP